MIFLYTDFGYEGPYVGQMKAILQRLAPGITVIDIIHNAPICNPRSAAYLLAALAQESEAGDVWLCVIDPGVGSERLPILLDCGGVSFVGPNNGLLELIYRRVPGARRKVIEWRPEKMSSTFHGRDLFAPVTAWCALGMDVPGRYLNCTTRRPGEDWPDNLGEVIYIDFYGNVMTGIGGSTLTDDELIRAGSTELRYANTFSAVPDGAPFWHRNSSGLIEISCNQARAKERLNLKIGDLIEVV